MFKIEVKVRPEVLTNLETRFTRALRRGFDQLTLAAHREWMNAAGRKLYTTRRDYQKALSHKKIDDDTAVIELHHPNNKTNWLVTALEVGVGTIDMKKALLESPTAEVHSAYHKTKPGAKKIGAPFVDVPFKAGQSDKPMFFRRVSPRSAGWQHQGFRPVGAGGLAKPLREGVKQYIGEQAPGVLKPIIEAAVGVKPGEMK